MRPTYELAFTAPANNPALLTTVAKARLNVLGSELAKLGDISKADCCAISVLIVAMVASTAATACTWSEVPAVSAFVPESAACSGVNKADVLVIADIALLRSADIKADSAGDGAIATETW